MFTIFKIFNFKVAAAIVSLFITLALVSFQLSTYESVARLQLNKIEGMIYDFRLNTYISDPITSSSSPSLNSSSNLSPSIIIVDIDEKTMREQGRFPWSRFKIAELVDQLFQAGVVVIAFDILFAEQEVNPVDLILQRSQSSELANILSPYRDKVNADKKLIESLKQGDVILGTLFNDQVIAMTGELPSDRVTIPVGVEASKITAIRKNSHIGVIDQVYQAAQQKGLSIKQAFINSTPDSDGSIRSAALVMAHQNEFYASLALSAVSRFLLAEQVKLITAPHGAAHHIVGVELDQKFIPTDAMGKILVPYKGAAKSFQYISATDVLEGRVNPNILNNSLVFVGTSAAGLSDLRETPVGIQYPGVEVHANIAAGLFETQQLKHIPDVANELVAIYLFVIGLLLIGLLSRFNPFGILLIGSGFIVGTLLLNYQLYVRLNIALPMATSLLLVILLTLIYGALGYITELTKRQKIKRFFDQYVPAAHIDKILNSPNTISLAGERKEMSVLFCDIRNFTRISESLSASELKIFLNQYFNPISQSILDNKGTIDKYVGDLVMAFWGAPLEDKHHAQHSIEAAFDMLEAVSVFNHKLAERSSPESWSPEIKVGIGINSGEMNVGDMGSDYRKAYTVLGDSVNLASRLEPLTKYYHVDLLVSEYTARQAPQFKYRLIDKVKVRGKDKAVVLFEPIHPNIASTEYLSEELDIHQQAYQAYLLQAWDKAETLFSQLALAYPNRGLYQIYVARIQALKTSPYIENWDGCFVHNTGVTI